MRALPFYFSGLVYTMNNFKNGYTCLQCAIKYGILLSDASMTPLYFRMDGKFIFADLVNCKEHGVTKSIALKDIQNFHIKNRNKLLMG